MSVAIKARPEVQGLRVEVVEGRDAFVQLEREWNAALAKGPRKEPMLRHEWFRAFIENFAPGATLRTFVVREGRELHAALPLLETRERSADTLWQELVTWALPVNDQSQRGGFLLGRRHAEALPLLWTHLVETPGWDRLRLRELPQGAAEWGLRDLAEAAGFPCGLWVSLRSPFLRLPALPAPREVKPGEKPTGKPQKQPQKPAPAAAPGEARYALVEAALDGKFRQNLRRRRRRLAETGEVKYVLLDGKDAAALDRGLADFFDLEASGWKGRGGTAIAQRPELVGFYTQLARDAAKRGALALGFVEVAGRRIAAHLSMVEQGAHYLLKVAYDETLSEFSPGQQLASEAIRDACARGLAEFDFLGPCMDWKLDWEPGLRTHQWLTIFRPTGRNRLIHEARFTAWPILRSLMDRARASFDKGRK